MSGRPDKPGMRKKVRSSEQPASRSRDPDRLCRWALAELMRRGVGGLYVIGIFTQRIPAEEYARVHGIPVERVRRLSAQVLRRVRERFELEGLQPPFD